MFSFDKNNNKLYNSRVGETDFILDLIDHKSSVI